jgi:hypothetical protein
LPRPTASLESVAVKTTAHSNPVNDDDDDAGSLVGGDGDDDVITLTEKVEEVTVEEAPKPVIKKKIVKVLKK